MVLFVEKNVSWLLGTIAVLLLLDLILRVIYVRLVLRIFEAKPPFSAPILPPHPLAETIEFQTRNGLVLRGSLYRHPERASRGLILFCPEMDCSHWSAMSLPQAVLALARSTLQRLAARASTLMGPVTSHARRPAVSCRFACPPAAPSAVAAGRLRPIPL